MCCISNYDPPDMTIQYWHDNLNLTRLYVI